MMTPYEYTVTHVRQRQERLNHEAEHNRLIKHIRRPRTGYRLGTVLVKTGILLITAGKRLQQHTPRYPALSQEKTGKISLNTH